MGAIIIGIISGIVMMVGSDLLERKFKLDDAVGAISVHGFCGVIGTILTGALCTTNGLFYTGSFAFLGIQTLGTLIIAAWGFTTAYIVLTILKKVSGIRVSEAEEVRGLDLSEHGECAYAEFLLKDEAKN